jgi:hypothetical protein
MFDLEEQKLDPVGGADPVLQVRLALAALAGEDRTHWTTKSMSERVLELLEVQERLSAEILRLVGVWQRTRAWEADGSLAATSWIEHRVPLSRSEARRVVKAARIADEHPALGEALAAGDVTVAHLDAVAKVTSRHREPLLSDHAEVLTEQAAQLSIADFSTVMRRWAALADDALATDTHEQRHERRHVHASVTLDGWVAGAFLLEPVIGRSFIDTLDYLEPPDPVDTPEGPRSLPQRRADALAELVDRHRQGRRGQGNPPNLNVVVDVAALPPKEAAGVDDLAELLNSRRDLDGIGPVSTAALEQLACCATVTPVFTKGGNVILAMGRRRRLATRAQLRALAVRDGHCQFPSCRRPARWCDAHHIISWLNGGLTDLDNLILLCRRHHTMIHNTKWTITRNPEDGTVTAAHPARSHPARGP